MDQMQYSQIILALREFYNHNAAERDTHEKESWKVEERQRFLTRLQAEGKQSLLEIGAGTGKDSQFFQLQGLVVTATDLSPAMAQCCREKGLTAHVMDFLHLDFPAHTFDVVYALNSLLHVPKRDLPAVLTAIRDLLKPGGLFYLGVYGGRDFEGIWLEDRQEPKRFFSFFTDDQIRQVVRDHFDLLEFKTIALDREENFHFQSMVLRKPAIAL